MSIRSTALITICALAGMIFIAVTTSPPLSGLEKYYATIAFFIGLAGVSRLAYLILNQAAERRYSRIHHPE